MMKSSFILLLVSLILLMIPEFSLANKFVTIGGGVSGVNTEKMEVLKQITAYSGLFLITLGILSLLTRERFEGFIGMRTKREGNSPVSYVLILLGGLLSIFFFI